MKQYVTKNRRDQPLTNEVDVIETPDNIEPFVPAQYTIVPTKITSEYEHICNTTYGIENIFLDGKDNVWKYRKWINTKEFEIHVIELKNA